MLLGASLGTWTAVLAFATFLVAIVAVFAEPLRRWHNRTKVDVTLNALPPDLHQIEMTNTFTGEPAGNAIYSRLRVSNAGTVAAENVEVFVSEVRSGSRVVPTFLPLSLTWSHYVPPSSTMRIPAGMYRHCDLGRFQEHNGDVVFLVSTIVQPNAVSSGLPPNFLPAGEYEIDTTFGGDNVELWSATWRVTFEGPWSDDESVMLKRIKLSRAKNKQSMPLAPSMPRMP